MARAAPDRKSCIKQSNLMFVLKRKTARQRVLPCSAACVDDVWWGIGCNIPFAFCSLSRNVCTLWGVRDEAMRKVLVSSIFFVVKNFSCEIEIRFYQFCAFINMLFLHSLWKTVNHVVIPKQVIKKQKDKSRLLCNHKYSHDAQGFRDLSSRKSQSISRGS